ncbi:fumarylacetoacetate hydrolase family protein [Actinomadura madurae]|uniref:fumarylacetoacetate hydrolase family protein n=1 Tax=Actinomadura madurae TaxID=1993 RepID=UPI00210ED8FD|nr:fumarylacetoacetate hydrolase family protein [Actinomadura madurae]
MTPRSGTWPADLTVHPSRRPDDFELGCLVNGEQQMQKGRTRDVVFPVGELIARLSAVTPLLPGDHARPHGLRPLSARSSPRR